MTENNQLAHPTEYLPAPMSKEQAAYLLRTIWPKAPEVDVIKAAILCRQYNLNPLMRQVYLIQFDKEWVIVLGIKASRQIAQQALRRRGIRYSYADGPRIMSDEEQKKTFGAVDEKRIFAITVLKDNYGATFPGYGSWPKNKTPYGTDKGNTEFNQAFIRSERNALDRMAPGELPDIDVADDSYIIGDFKAALEIGKAEFTEKAELSAAENWPQDQQPSIEKNVDMLWLKETLEALKEKLPGRYMKLQDKMKGYLAGRPFNTWGQAMADITDDQAAEFVKEVQAAVEEQ